MQMLRELWARWRYSEWYLALPEGLREPPGVYLTAAVAALLVGAAIYGLLRLALRLVGGGGSAPGFRRGMERQIRALSQAGDFAGVGQRYETLGKTRAARAAYRRGGCWEELARLLVREGRRKEAKKAARQGEAWVVYADLCHEDGEHREAAEAYERGGKLYDAARGFEAAGERLRAARCYTAVGLEAKAAELLTEGEDRETAEALEASLRASLLAARGDAMSPEMAVAVRRAAQLWVSLDEAERAYSLAVASEQWAVAVPIARDYLEPRPEMAEVCLRAGDRLAAAEIWKKLGEPRHEALCRAEHYLLREEHAAAAEWYERAEEWAEAAGCWAAGGETLRAADLYARAEEFGEAAKLYAAAGEGAKQKAMENAGRARDPRAVLEAEEQTRQIRPQGGSAGGGQPTAGARPPAAGSPAAAEAPTAVGPAIAQAGAPTEPGARYILQEAIGRGGMGVVYRAHDTMLKRMVAYKVLSPEVSGAVTEAAGLLEEARSAARLSHPNIVQIYDAGQAANGFFIVMELVEGENFADLLKKNRLSIEGVITVALQITSALDHAHKRRIIHRDLKPSNLMWTEERQIKLTDFGLARAFEDSIGKVMTRPAGTPYYMSPEQIRGAAVDPRTDIYSLGCVLFELLCQRTPFVGGVSSIHDHLNSRPEDPRMSREEIPPRLSKIILHCLEKDPEKRPGSAAEVDRMLRDVRG